MARILTRPLFRKGGLSKTPRPSYRGGGVTAIRPGYRGGGRMSGIMSGIVPRRGYADGPNIPGTPIVPIQNLTEQKPWWGQRVYDWLNPSPETVMERYNRRLEGLSAAGRPSTKSKWLELAKAGLGVAGAPGGDLLGTIAREGQKGIEGLSKEMAASEAAKQSARLMGLKAGLEKTDTGEFGKKIRTLSKLTKKSEKSIAEKFISGDTDFDAEYLAAAEAAGVEAGHSRKVYLENIKIMSEKHPDVAAQLNKQFPKKNPIEGEYYVLPNGKFTRWVDGEKLKPTDPGFYDKEA